MELIETKGVKHWEIGAIGPAGKAPVGFMMMFDASLKITVSVEELKSMQVAINKALEIKEEII